MRADAEAALVAGDSAGPRTSHMSEGLEVIGRLDHAHMQLMNIVSYFVQFFHIINFLLYDS